MVIGRVNKQSTETIPITIDYTGQLPASTTVSSVVVNAVRKSDGAAWDSVLAQNTSGIITSTTNTSVKFHVTSGTDGDAYHITVTTTLSDSSPSTVLVDELILTITDKPWD